MARIWPVFSDALCATQDYAGTGLKRILETSPLPIMEGVTTWNEGREVAMGFSDEPGRGAKDYVL